MSIPSPNKELRQLMDLHSVGPATLQDLKLLGITTLEHLAAADPRDLYLRLCTITRARHDPCAEDVFSAAVAQARNPNLPLEQCRWWYWSRQRKTHGQ